MTSNANVPKPHTGYERRKPNYYPEEPTDFEFFPAARRDPKRYTKIVWLTVAFFTTVFLYSGETLLFYFYGTPQVPTYKITSLSVSDFNLISYSQGELYFRNVTSAWNIGVSIQRHNPFTKIKCDLVHAYLLFQHIEQAYPHSFPVVRKLRVNPFDITKDHMSMQVNTTALELTYNVSYNGTVLDDDWTAGAMDFHLLLIYVSEYSAFWAPFGTRLLTVAIDCNDLNVRFSSSRSQKGKMMGLSTACSKTYDQINQTTINTLREKFNSEEFKAQAEDVSAV